MFSGFILEAIDLLRETLSSGGRLGEALKVSALTCLSGVKLVRGYVKLRLPMSLVAICPLGSLPEAWRNLLHVFYYRDYEQVPSFKPRRGWIVLDAGAYFGFYAMRASRLVGREGLVVAVEPVSSHFQVASENVRLNSLSNVRVLRACLAPRTRDYRVYVPCSSVNASIVRTYAESFGAIKAVEEVRGVSLESLVNVLGEVDLLKLDIEGLELEVIESSKQVLSPDKVRRLVVEVHRDIVDPHDVADVLEKLGYETAMYIDEEVPHQAFVYAAREVA